MSNGVIMRAKAHDSPTRNLISNIYFFQMPRNYTRKTTILSYTAEDLQKAISAIRNDGRKIREAGRVFNIPESTLRKQLLENENKHPRLGCTPVFSQEIESELREYVLTLAKLFYGLTPKCLRRLAFRYAEQHKIVHKFDKTKGLAGKDWLYGFLRRSPEIKLRQPEGTSLNRIASFNKESVKLFFSNLQTVLEKFKFEPNSVYNMDETGITTVQNKCPKVYGQKGSKKVGAAISGERGRTITAVFAMNAAGNYIPPMIIYPRKRMPKTLEKNGPIGALYKCSKNGWINSELFLQWLGHFRNYAKPSVTEPVLLVLDNHSSHISIAAFNFCKENNIHMVSLPPHTSDRLQPLDLTFFSPLKNALFREYELYLSSTGHQKITEYDIAELLNKAFMKVATMEKAVSGFRTSGIIPLNPDKFVDADFEASLHVGKLTVEATPELETSTSQDGGAPVLDNRPDRQHHRDPSPQPSTSQDNSFFALAPIPTPKVNQTTKRKYRNKQKSEILTSTPIRTKLEEAEEKKRQREEAIKTKEKLKDKNKRQGVIRKCFDSESSNQSPSKKFKSKKKKPPTPESSDSSENDVSEICDDDELDDIEDDIEDDIGLRFIPPAVSQPAEPNEFCGICGEFGKQRELWYRCVLCSIWNHAECTDSDTPKNYICDLCSS